MSGVTETGFETKRFAQIIEGLKNQAVPIFQDLTPPGDVVDTSDSTLLGRLIGLVTPALAEVWEAAEEVYSAFDPNSSAGIPLDSLVSLGGLVRQPASPTTFSAAVWGDVYTEIPTGSLIRAANGNDQFTATTAAVLTPTGMIGAGLSVDTLGVGEEYSVTLSSYSGIVSISTVGLAGDTKYDVLERLADQLIGNATYGTDIEDDILYIMNNEHYSSFDVLLGGEISQAKVAKRMNFQSVNTGPVNAVINTLNTIVTPVLGWDGVNNPVPAVIGTNEETDEELRERFRESKYVRAGNTGDAIYSALRELEGVKEIRVYNNPENITDAIGLPPHSFKVLMVGGNDTDIARVIWRNTPLGISSEGSQEVAVLNSQGYEQIVKFDRPVYVPIYVEVELDTYGSEFPEGGELLVKQALVDYIAGSQTIGGRVVYSRLFNPVNTVPGHEIVSLKIGTDSGVLSESTIDLEYNEIATLAIEDITVIL